jgi:hypothetical protein
MRQHSEVVEYPALKGKVISQVRFTNDDDFTALIVDFEDQTHVSFRFKADMTLSMEPEISILQVGNIVNWRELKAQPARMKGPKLRKGDKAWITWENLDGPPGIGRGLALCEVVTVRKRLTTVGKLPYVEVRIRDPKGRLWRTPASSLIPYEQRPKEQTRTRRRGKL